MSPVSVRATVPTAAAGGAVVGATVVGATVVGATVADDDDCDEDAIVCTGVVAAGEVTSFVVVGLVVLLSEEPQATIITDRHAAVPHVPIAAILISRPLTSTNRTVSEQSPRSISPRLRLDCLRARCDHLP